MKGEMVFPAYAGVIPEFLTTISALGGVPRIRGGDPGKPLHIRAKPTCAPHTRG